MALVVQKIYLLPGKMSGWGPMVCEVHFYFFSFFFFLMYSFLDELVLVAIV